MITSRAKFPSGAADRSVPFLSGCVVQSQEKPLERIKRLLQLSFRRGYPYAGAASQLWLLSYNVRYLFDRTPYWRPWLAFMRVDVRRMAAEDYVSRFSDCEVPERALTVCDLRLCSHRNHRYFHRAYRLPCVRRLHSPLPCYELRHSFSLKH